MQADTFPPSVLNGSPFEAKSPSSSRRHTSPQHPLILQRQRRLPPFSYSCYPSRTSLKPCLCYAIKEIPQPSIGALPISLPSALRPVHSKTASPRRPLSKLARARSEASPTGMLSLPQPGPLRGLGLCDRIPCEYPSLKSFQRFSRSNGVCRIAVFGHRCARRLASEGVS